jgi:hypothetical protein
VKGFEPSTYSSGGCRSIQLSYTRTIEYSNASPKETLFNLPESFWTVNRFVFLAPFATLEPTYSPKGPWTVSSVIEDQPLFSSPSR